MKRFLLALAVFVGLSSFAMAAGNETHHPVHHPVHHHHHHHVVHHHPVHH